MNISGLDMAVVGNSYLYHMRKDLVENIEVGVAQHMGENTLALIQYLTSDKSTLPELASGSTSPATVFFTYVGRIFISYSYTAAKVMYSILLWFTFVLAKARNKSAHKLAFWPQQIEAAKAVCLGVVGTFVAPNLVAVIMRNVLHKNLSWFSDPFAPILLYGPACLLGAYPTLS